MATPRYEFILSDIYGSVLGELTTLSNAVVTDPLLRLPTASGTLALWHPMAEKLMTQDTLLRVYRTDHLGTRRLIHHGIVITAEEKGDKVTQTVAFNSVGPLWRFGKRIFGTTKAGFALGTSTSLVDLGQMMHDIVSTANGQGFTGVGIGTRTNTKSAFLPPVWLKNAGEQLVELSNNINGPEFTIVPQEPTYPSGTFPQIGVMNVGPFVGGVTRPDAIYEYGGGRTNVAEYTRTRDLQGVLTRALISVSGWPDGTSQSVISVSDSTEITNRGLYEEVVPDAGITNDTLRTDLATYHLGVRKKWRELVVFKPATNARPAPYTDYDIGDFVRGRITVKGALRTDAYFRVWGATFNIDKNGNENIDLDLVPQEAGI